MENNRQFLVNKQDFQPKGYEAHPLKALEDGKVRLRIQKYAFTSNNVTYALVGYRVRYWEFFPVDDTMGIIPVWGFAEVTDSTLDNIAVGERFYGYYPMADYLDVSPGKINAFGFMDLAAHRQELNPIYNYYSRVGNDLNYKPEYEDFIPLIRPLFTTGFLNYYFIKEEQFAKVDQVVLTSASSKTALSLAKMLKKNQGEDKKQIIGLTSARNVEFVQNTGYYDQVVTYDAYTDGMPQKPTVVVDFAGNSALLQGLHALLGEHLSYISLIGMTDWKSEKGFKTLENAQFFFAPTQAQKQFAAWGTETTNKRIAEALFEFIDEIKSAMHIKTIHEEGEILGVYQDMFAGKVDPGVGYIIVSA